MRSKIRFAALGCALLAGCTGRGVQAPAPGPAAAAAARPACDPGNGGITLPAGFCALVVTPDVAPGAARARHVVVAPNGDLYVAVQGRNDAQTPGERGGIVALRDTSGDGRADQSAWFGPQGGTGLALRDGYLYFATNTAVLRFRMGAGLEPVSGPDTLVMELPAMHSHAAKSIAVGPNNQLWVNIGSPTNACQPLGRDREAGVRGEDPCTQLETRAGVWLFDASRLRQRQADGQRWATGIRNAVALEYNEQDNTLYAAQHGRDQLNSWPGFTPEDNAERPAEELQRLTRGADFGWPYCYFDTRLRRRVLAPEYGGDGQQVGRCADRQLPLVAFPGHWAPNDLIFLRGERLPARYRGGALIAFHGSWNRAPLQQAGYNVAFVPFQNGQLSEAYEIFADGFAGPNPQPNQAAHRPMGLAQGPDGSIYITDSNGGTIWRVMYVG